MDLSTAETQGWKGNDTRYNHDEMPFTAQVRSSNNAQQKLRTGMLIVSH